MKFAVNQEEVLVNLLWDSLNSVPGHPDRRQTKWGGKTKEGLVACVQRIVDTPQIVDPSS